MTPERKGLITAWIEAGLWIAIIAFESTDLMSAEHTSRYLYPLCHFLFGVGLERFAEFHHYLRKMGHFVGYFALSGLLFRAWKSTLQLPRPRVWTLRWAGVAFVMATLVASLDEWHQTFIPSRTGRVEDVMLDSSAALTAQLVIFLYLRTKKPVREISG